MNEFHHVCLDQANTLTPPRQLRVGVVTGHSEAVVPSAAGYEIFFTLLNSLPVRVEEFEGALTSDALNGLDALLIGAPGRELGGREVRAVRRYLRRGGRVLVFSDAGGDARPRGRVRSRTNIGRLLGHRLKPSGVVGRYTGRNGEEESLFKLSLRIDASSVLGHPGMLHYESGPVTTFDDLNKVISRALRRKSSLRDVLSWPRKLLSRFNWRHRWDFSHTLEAPRWAFQAEVTRRDGCLAAADKSLSIPVSQPPLLFLRRRFGRGRITFLGSCNSMRDDYLARGDNAQFLHRLMELWLPHLFDQEVLRRAVAPQRHRLLQGYPMAPAMDLHSSEAHPTAETDPSVETDWVDAERSARRQLIVGVLPHPFCNPKITGCGFCTFPHEAFAKSRANTVVERVIDEIDAVVNHQGELVRRPVDALYFGGGTANLTPPESFEKLCRKLSATFDLSDAEVTLEGVPIYFLTREGLMLDILRDSLPARHHRISMGVQTFDPEQLKSMGRTAFGSRDDITRLVELAHDRGMTVSGDLLFNLPGQTVQQMTKDVKIAGEIDFDQICLYHLVMFEGLGTAWSEDPNLLAQLPDNDRACENWKEMVNAAFEADYDPTTLTNFEHERVMNTERRFVYEILGFQPEKVDALGFGPGAISQNFNFGRSQGHKRINPERAEAYCAAVQRCVDAQSQGRYFERSFDYEPIDLKILYLTRKMALLSFSRASYHDLFASDPLDDFAEEFEALEKTGLVHIDIDQIRLTRDGMFYADTVAGLLAWRRLAVRQMERRATSVAPAEQTTFKLARYSAALHRMG